MTNKTNLPPIDLKQFEADTRFDIRDAMPELAVFTILWHNMGYGTDAALCLRNTRPTARRRQMAGSAQP